MSDPLLDEATRVADAYQREIPSGISPIADLLRALVERVRAAEAGEREAREHMASNGYLALRMEAQRDEARGKLDKVRAAASRYLNECDQSEVLASDVLAILDGDNGR